MPQQVRNIISDHLWYMKIFRNMQHETGEDGVRSSNTLAIIELIFNLFSQENIKDTQVPDGTTAEQIFGDIYMPHIQPVYAYVADYVADYISEKDEGKQSCDFDAHSFCRDHNAEISTHTVNLCGYHLDEKQVRRMNDRIYLPGEQNNTGVISNNHDLKPFIEPTPKTTCFCFSNRIVLDPRIAETVARLGRLQPSEDQDYSAGSSDGPATPLLGSGGQQASGRSNSA